MAVVVRPCRHLQQELQQAKQALAADTVALEVL
jgi:hypothetical protein